MWGSFSDNGGSTAIAISTRTSGRTTKLYHICSIGGSAIISAGGRHGQ